MIQTLGVTKLVFFLLLQNTDALRTGLLVVMAFGIALPLALLRNLDSLSNINAISLGFYAVFVAEVMSMFVIKHMHRHRHAHTHTHTHKQLHTKAVWF